MGCLDESHDGMATFATVPLNAQTGRVCVCVSADELIKVSECVEHVDWIHRSMSWIVHDWFMKHFVC